MTTSSVTDRSRDLQPGLLFKRLTLLIGAALFWRAFVRYRGHGAGTREAWTALSWNVLVWLGFIAGTELFVAYTAESPFRELLIIALAMAVVVAVVPDNPNHRAGD